jgi:inorganic phosphate transporter, PiT family
VAALTSGIFVILGATIDGAGTTDTLTQLGAINALGGSFTVALASAITVTWMTKVKMPVSTTQAIVGGILGWNWFTGLPTNFTTLTQIVSTWFLSPLIAAIFAILLFKITVRIISRIQIHLLEIDIITRIGLLTVGAFGAYSLGANNIANVMGVFVSANPFKDLRLGSTINIGAAEQLFFLGALAISTGIYSYSRKVMLTVGNELYKLTPFSALIVVLSVSLVLFIFASQKLSAFFNTLGLPPIPLVPVSSTQAVIGAVIGIGIAKGGKGIRYRVMGKIAVGWVATPVATALLSFLMLFFVQNVFEIPVVRP